MSEQNTSALFPAYSLSSDAKNFKVVNEEWLTNASFTTDTYQSLFQSESTSQVSGSSEKCLPKLKVYETKTEKPPLKRKKVLHDEDKIPQNNSELQKHLGKVTFLEETGLSYDRAYRIDTTYDPENFSLESFDIKTIPKYKCEATIPLGATGNKFSDYMVVENKKAKKKSIRYFSRGCMKQLKAIVKKISPSNQCLTDLPQYLPFSTSSDKAIVDAHLMVNFDGISEDWKSYFSKVSKDLLPKEGLFEPVDVELHEKIASFNNALMELPHNEQMWLDFVTFQQDVFQSSTFVKNSLTETSVYEKQIAILNKALKHNPNSVMLTVAKLEILKNIEEKELLISAWENLIFYNPNSAVAWKHYFKFILSDIAYFNVSRIIKLFSKCVETLSNVLEGRMQSHRPPPGLIMDMIDIFGSMCTIIQSFGYRELALGSFQAQIEFNLFSPFSVVNLESHANQVAFFEPFWDSGVPRVGEENAIGWCKTVTEKVISTNAAASVLGLEESEDAILQGKLPQWQTWLKFERLREINHFLPWRPDPNLDQKTDDLDDSERLVSFDQISRFLFRAADERARFSLLCHFFSFLGVCLHSIECSSFCKKDELLVLDNFTHIYAVIKDIFLNGEVPQILNLSQNSSYSVNFAFTESVFQQAIDVFSDYYKSLISLRWLKHRLNSAYVNSGKMKNSMKNLKKFAKTLLKRSENRNCLFLWSEYVHIEWLSGNREEANRTCETLLLLSTKDYTATGFKALCHFIRKYIELCLGLKTLSKVDFDENCNRILWILSHIGRKEKYVPYNSEQVTSPVMVAKAALGFKALLNEELLHLSHSDEFQCQCLNPLAFPLLDCCLCLVYLKYIVNGLDSALQQFEEVLLHLKNVARDNPTQSLKYLEEQLLVLHAELLNFHSWSCSQSLKLLQTFLYDAIEKFPGNVRLLYLLLKIKVSLPVIGPTRRFFYKLIQCNKNLTPVTWLFAIISELIICFSIEESLSCPNTKSLKQGESSLLRNCGIVWKIRSLFENALKSSNARHSVALWRSHIKYEIMIGEVSKAKTVFHQAIQNCPWVKALYLDGVEHFPEDLRYLLETMNEKQLRVHTPLEEVILLMEHAVKDD